MKLVLVIYLVGVVINLAVYCFYLIKDYSNLNVNKTGSFLFILFSWLIYPILLLKREN